ncbi:MAG: Type I signal peptidase [Candidatus Woesebacteria bacterium GW2011_GWA1_37_8]|uniref:Signal peptidase I n=1 Tax=Candidatus Woesebacteria bacterium GW2011_GWA1_37_8 TaxID=1618546 RepID=A0A0G0I3B6_9BACT|nr:MAG: Type I signal peptidase [Candidatus Woesebacteria bacterium GW2011_GWA1_37_8]
MNKIIRNYKWVVFFLISFIAFEAGFVATLIITPQKLTDTFQNLKIGKGSLPRVYIVQSGSMQPAIKTGSLEFSIPQNNYRVGEVVTFSLSPTGKNLVTHRIKSISGEEEITTKGDANEDADSQTVKSGSIVGKTAFTVPYLGYIANFAKNPKGFILLVIVPATIVIYEEMKNLRKEIAKFLGKAGSKLFKKKKGNIPSTSLRVAYGLDYAFPSPLPKTKNVPAYAIAIPVFGVLLVLIAFSASYFSDREKSESNILGAAESFGTPTPTSATNGTPTPTPIPTGGVVVNEVYYRIANEHKIDNSEAGSEWIELYNLLKNGSCAAGTIIDHISWGSNVVAFNPSIPLIPTSGSSSERNPDGVDTNTNADFTTSTPPTPGI